MTVTEMLAALTRLEDTIARALKIILAMDILVQVSILAIKIQ